jgi:1-acyl-sn-glycerol-3-phosphate acyltransferase
MAEQLERCWRVVAVAIGFICFGVGGLTFGIVVFPLINLLVRDDLRRAHIAKGVIHHAFRCFVGLLRVLGVFSYEVRGLERVQAGGGLILANHPTLLDVVFLMSLVRRADCIVKADLAHNPFMRGPVRAAGFVFNDSGADLIGDCIRSVHSGNNMIIFPEGTRTPASGVMRLKRGAAHVALQGEVDIMPVQIRCADPFLRKGEKWYRLPLKRPHFEIIFGDAIPVAHFDMGDAGRSLAARRLTEHLTQYFSAGSLPCKT